MAQSNSVNPFLSNLVDFDPRAAFGLEKAPVTENDDAPSGYALVQTGPAVSAEECENLAARAVEVSVLWGTTVIHVAHLDPPRAYFGGEQSDKTAKCEVTLPADKIGTTRMPIVSMVGGEPCVVVPAGASASVEKPGAQSETAAPGACIPLTLGTRIALRFGDLSIRVSGVHPGKRARRAYFAENDRSAAGFFGLSALVAASFIGAMAFFVPGLGITDDETADQDRTYMIQQYLSANAEANRELTEDNQPASDAQQGGGERADAARGSSGALGKDSAKLANKRAGVQGPPDNPNPTLARERALEEARNIGMIGLLNTMNGDPSAPTSPFGQDFASGKDEKSAMGNMWGDEIGDSLGSGGLGLTGIGEGGGGKGIGVGINGIGTCGGTICSGLEGGFGRSLARTGPGHATKAPNVRPMGVTVTSGRIPPEVIQRIVRQNYGRFRMCYEAGLAKNPNLQGHVTARFVIGRDGSVSNVQNGGSDLADGGVVSCVVSAYYGLSFPAPEGGIVTVSYPIMFTPG